MGIASKVKAVKTSPRPRGRPPGATTEQLGASRFKNALDAGFPLALVRAVSSALLRVAAGGARIRFITFALTGSPTVSEKRIPANLLKECRVVAKDLGVRHVYFPKRPGPPSVVIDKDAAKWLKQNGFSTRTIADTLHVSGFLIHNLLRDVEVSTEPVERRKLVDQRSDDFVRGIDWLKDVVGKDGRPIGTRGALELYGPSRVARVGQALIAMKSLLGREPRRIL